MNLDVGPLSREQSEAAGRELEAEGRRIHAALKAADDLAAFIAERAVLFSNSEGSRVIVSFETADAAVIADKALAYQRTRAGETA